MATEPSNPFTAAQINFIEHCWIPLADGTRLAATLWLPGNVSVTPVPAILEYLPYRKTDGTAQTDPVRHAFFAAHGYAGVRVDMRGSGDADGLMFDEYHPQELLDGVEVIAWLARQSWCNGKVGMIGISWGGFNALQVAALRPPALAAIISVGSTVDRYTDDVHYLGGNVLARDALVWPTSFTAILARPPDPRWQGAAWRDRWLARLDALPHFAALWLQHQSRDDYWRHGSMVENFGAINCPVYAVGGWADAYTNAVPRLLAGLTVPRKGLIGPWAHHWPNSARPAPAISFLSECVRWWDHWLKGIDTGIMREPMLRAWLQEFVSPINSHRARPGRWIAEPSWPAPAARIALQPLTLTQNGLADHAPALVDDRTAATIASTGPWQRTIATLLRHGEHGGAWCPFGMRGDLPGDQRAEDARAMTFDAAPALTSVDLLGHAALDVDVASDQPDGTIVARLCDVAPDGTSLFVTRAVLRLTRRDGHAQGAPITPHRSCRVRLTFDVAGHTLAVGHRWRLAIAPSYWPMIWPAAELVTLAVSGGELRLPLRTAAADNPAADATPFGAADGAPPLAVTQAVTGSADRRQVIDVLRGELRFEQSADQGRVRFSHGLETTARSRDAFIIQELEPGSARLESTRSFSLQRADWQIDVTIDASIHTATRTDGQQANSTFVIEQTLRARENGREVRVRHWLARINRMS